MHRKRIAFYPCPWLCLALALLAMFSVAGCAGERAANMDWAAPSAAEQPDGGGSVQETLDAYAAALVAKDRAGFLATIDPADAEFVNRQAEMFDRLAEVPFADYLISVTSQNQTAPGRVTAKVESAYTYLDSFPGLPDPDRSAFELSGQDGGWKISGDATLEALGRPREAGLEDFGPVKALITDRVIVLYHSGHESTAGQVAELAGQAFPRLEASVPGVNLPKVPVRIFDSTAQMDLAFPGKWTEWTGGAARQLGAGADQGGEIIVDAGTFNEVDGFDPGYNLKMLAHELTHVALFPMTDFRTPPFLIEGLADYVAGEDEVSLLREKMRGGETFSPTLRDLYQPSGFSTLLTTETATLAYEQSDTAVALLEERYGNEKVLELLREFKRRGPDADDQDKLVDETFRTVLGIGWTEFEEEWRRYVVGG